MVCVIFALGRMLKYVLNFIDQIKSKFIEHEVYLK